jgi:predicted small secreted protein
LIYIKKNLWQTNKIIKGEHEMKITIKLIGLMIALFIIVVGVMGCNTMEGAGKDIEKGGKAIQKAAD